MPAPYEIVMREALEEMGLQDDEELIGTMRTGMQRQMNMVGGRPSDCMRSEVWDLRRRGRDDYINHTREVGTNLRNMGY